jgi:hypothetical protein
MTRPPMTRKPTTVAVAGLATLALACAAMLLASSPAPAIFVHRYEREINGSATPAGSFSPHGVAVDNSTGSSAGSVYVSDFEHVVDSFGSLGEYMSQLTGYTKPLGIAIDNSAGLSARGGVYVADYGNGSVYKGESVFASGLTGANSVAVDQATGDVYVVTGENSKARNNEENFVYKFGPSGAALSPLEGFRRPYAVGVDNTCYYAGLTGSACTSADPSNGDVYVVEDGGNELVSKFDATGKLLSQWSVEGDGGVALAVDQSTGDVYVTGRLGGGGKFFVYEFDQTGKLLSQMGESSPGYSTQARRTEFVPYSVAVDRVTGDVYAGDLSNFVVDVFGPAIELPEAFTGSSSGLLSTSVTLAGEVNPKGNDTTSFFEYGACANATCSPSDPYSSKQSTVQAPTGPSPGSPDDGSGTANVPVEASVTGLIPNQSYHYQLAAENKNAPSPPGGEREFRTPSVPPQVETLQPSVVGFEVAALSGSVNPEHSETAYRFEYGPCATSAECAEAKYATQTQTHESSVYEVLGAFQEIEVLPSSGYHYRLVAQNSAGVTYGGNVTFTTAPVPPLVVESGTASAVTQTSAVISGSLDPNGLASAYGFQLGTQAGVYGPQVGTGTIALGIFQAQSVTFALEGLQPGTTYHYRLLASNAYNAVVYGADQSFTTVGAAPSFTQPFALPLLATPAIAFPVGAGEATVKGLTRARQLARALKACAKKRKSQRAVCERIAQKKYGSSKAKGKRKGKKK